MGPLLQTVVILAALCRVQLATSTGEGDTLRGYSDPSETANDSGRMFVELFDYDKPNKNYPLGNCEGDCDIDEHCDGELKCFIRKGLATVPGCAGEGESGNDYVSHCNVAIVIHILFCSHHLVSLSLLFQVLHAWNH